MQEYVKIPNIFVRSEETKKLVRGEFSSPTLEALQNIRWEFTEKIDGTNIRVCWDGHRVTFAGRTERASIPAPLVNRLDELFGGTDNEEIFEQMFGETAVILFGEGYGGRIQTAGPLYGPEPSFILFDALITGNYQPRSSVQEIAKAFRIQTAPVVLSGTLNDAVEYVAECDRDTTVSAGDRPEGDKRAVMEGLVGRPVPELRDRCGNRVIVKIKRRDFR